MYVGKNGAQVRRNRKEDAMKKGDAIEDENATKNRGRNQKGDAIKNEVIENADVLKKAT